jgi:arabinan endo-1,5-alpha-L-arabinosidase
MNDNTRGLVLYYQWVNKTIGVTTDKFQFGWNVLKWVDGWPSV